MEKEKNLFEKISDLKGKEGFIKLSDKDKNSILSGEENYLDKEHERKENLIWLLLGLCMGILGNFIVNFLYDLIKISEFKFQTNLIFIALFCVGLFILFSQLDEHNKNIKYTHESKERWRKATQLNVGPAFKPIDGS